MKGFFCLNFSCVYCFLSPCLPCLLFSTVARFLSVWTFSSCLGVQAAYGFVYTYLFMYLQLWNFALFWALIGSMLSLPCIAVSFFLFVYLNLTDRSFRLLSIIYSPFWEFVVCVNHFKWSYPFCYVFAPWWASFFLCTFGWAWSIVFTFNGFFFLSVDAVAVFYNNIARSCGFGIWRSCFSHDFEVIKSLACLHVIDVHLDCQGDEVHYRILLHLLLGDCVCYSENNSSLPAGSQHDIPTCGLSIYKVPTFCSC